MSSGKLHYRLGLDIGSTSIGWCMIRLDTHQEPCAVIRAGVRIFSDGRNPKDGSSLAVTRRNARQMRRRRDRLLKRKARLISALVRLGFFPSDEAERRAVANLDPYELRRRGLDLPLTGPEFARALFHLNQRRGFLSNRKTDRKDNDTGALKKAIATLISRLEEEQCRTLGEWLAKRHESRQSVRARLRGKTQKDRAYDFYADRSMIEHEFDLLWAKQSEINPGLFTEGARVELKDVLLYQRKLKPVKPGRCTLIPEEERAPLALPSTQRFRIYQEANHLRFIGQDLTERPLTRAERDTVVGLLERQSEVRFSKIARTLKLPASSSFNLEDLKRDRLKGNLVSAILSRDTLFGDRWYTFDASLQDTIVDHLINEASESALVSWLTEQTGVDDATAEMIANTQLPEGYGNLSRTALAQVIPELVNDVVVYSEAVVRAGFVSHSALSAGEQTGEIMEALPYYGEVLKRHVAFGTGQPTDSPELRYGKIANPTVHIGLNELRKVVNALIRRYGHPKEVIVEVARDLKIGRERRLEIQREQKERQDRNDKYVSEACEILGVTTSNLDRNKRRELSQKMQLWVELNKDVANRRCPYTGEQISIHRLLSDEVEIDHILPYSITLDDSLMNKTVAMRRANRDKGNRTPHAAFGERTVPGYDYDGIVERAAAMPKEKAKRFAPDGYARWLKEDKDFLARALNDTAYLSRVAKEYLSAVCPPNRVRAIPGRLTSLLRGKFGLNQFLSGSELKNRDDHRHHAIDAAVIAVTDQGLLQRFAQASASARERQLDRLVDSMPLPWPTYREHVARAARSIVVSHRPDHGYQGAMHEATAWGFRESGLVTRRVTPEGSSTRQREYVKKALVPINSTRSPERHGLDESGQPKAYKGYLGGSNYCIEIWQNERGKWVGDVISTFQAYQVVRELGETEGWCRLRDPRTTLAGKPLIMRLMIDDSVRMKVNDQWKLMRVAVIKSAGQMSLAEHFESNVDARNRDKDEDFSYITKSPGSLQTAGANRIVVSEIGDVRRLSPGTPV